MTPTFPDVQDLPVASSNPSTLLGLVGAMLFNFAVAPTVPSWANETRGEVPAQLALGVSLGLVVSLYSLVGLFGGRAFQDWNGDASLFTKLSESGSPVLRATVALYPILQNLTTIPVLSILIRYNLAQLGLVDPKLLFSVAFAGPWVLGLAFYGGKGFSTVCEVGGLVFSLAANFLLPVALHWLAVRSKGVTSTGAKLSNEEVKSAFTFGRHVPQCTDRFLRG